MTTSPPDSTPVLPDANPATMPIITTTTTNSSTAPSIFSSSDMEDAETDTSTTLTRPTLDRRKSSGTIIVPRDHPDVEIREEHFPPGDARAMSPRRTSVEVEKLGRDTRLALQKATFSHARTLQSGLNALAEKIEMVKSDHEKLEKQNVALQDYIGGLTRSMSRTDLAGKGKK
ncbi:hypothetical protein MMC29_008138 [Sticta canariensis]|nr:hypothetical protein [Sticta canariensis]